ncbi:MAG: hypothetical protein L0I66_07985 [Tetragenococcus halophilus]|nr:hypothetical protein [Tetragenococcus halophilus]
MELRPTELFTKAKTQTCQLLQQRYFTKRGDIVIASIAVFKQYNGDDMQIISHG